MDKEKSMVLEESPENNPISDKEDLKKTYCTRISPSPGVTLCNGILLFTEDLAVKNMMKV